MTLERGSFLHNRYRILEILGQGGMGSIYRAIDENLGVEVAVKENLFTTDEYARQFRREAIILANLRHANLPRVSDHFVIDGQGQYLVMDYIEGEDLRERMDRIGDIPESDILVIGIAICDALTYMHTRKPPVLHRDIKPGNVKITPQGEIFLVDFGLAKVVQAGQQTSTGARAMTPGYSPPEQYGAARTDNRSDIYSLGATMYAALVGTIPEDSLARTMDQTELTPIRKRNSKISRRAASAIEKALEVHPDDRYQNAEEFKQALLLAGNTSQVDVAGMSTISPKPDVEAEGKLQEIDKIDSEDHDEESASTPAPLPVSIPLDEDLEEVAEPIKKVRGRGFLITVAIVLAILAVAVGVSYIIDPTLPWRTLKSITDQSVSWVQSFIPGEVPSATSPLEPENSDTPVIIVQSSSTPVLIKTETPNSTKTKEATFTPEPSDKPTEKAVVLRTSTPTQTMMPTATALGGGSGQIAFASDRTGLPQIWVINVNGTGLHQITDTQWGACQPDWSPDGSQIVYTSPCDGNEETYQGSSLFIIDADGTNPTSLPIHGLGDYDPSWSPDGSKIVFTSLKRNDRPQILVFDLESGETQVLSMENFRDLQPSWSFDGSQILFISLRNGPYQVWAMDADGTHQIRFSVSGSKKDTNPILSPNGKLMVFTQSEGLGSVPYLRGAPYPDGAESEYPLYSAALIPMKDADFSYDGFWVALESWPDGIMHDIYIIAFNGAELTQITFDPALDFDPAWRPIKP